MYNDSKAAASRLTVSSPFHRSPLQSDTFPSNGFRKEGLWVGSSQVWRTCLQHRPNSLVPLGLQYSTGEAHLARTCEERPVKPDRQPLSGNSTPLVPESGERVPLSVNVASELCSHSSEANPPAGCTLESHCNSRFRYLSQGLFCIQSSLIINTPGHGNAKEGHNSFKENQIHAKILFPGPFIL